MSDEDPQASLAAALGKLPSGLFILTYGPGRTGSARLVSWVQQCSFEPPLVTIALNRSKIPPELQQAAAPFVLNQLGAGHTRLLSHFGKGFAAEEPCFQGIDVFDAASGPAILEMAVAYLECQLAERVAAGDHDLLIARVISGDIRSEDSPYVHIRKSGLRY